MRNGQNKRMRGRNNNNRGKSSNPLTRVYESNGPDVKIRGTASHVGEKYIQLARDSLASGDPVGAENYYQHAEHYFRLIAAAQEQFRQTQQQPYPRPDGEQPQQNADAFDDGDDQIQGEPGYGGGGAPYQQRDGQYQQHPQHQPREHQHYQQRDQQQPYPREQQPRQQGDTQADVAGLPSFITGQQAQQGNHGPQNGGHEGQGDRFPLHRRRRRHRGPRSDMQGGGDHQPGPRPPSND